MRKSLVSKVLSCAEIGRERRRKKEVRQYPVSWSRPNVDADTARRDPGSPTAGMRGSATESQYGAHKKHKWHLKTCTGYAGPAIDRSDQSTK